VAQNVSVFNQKLLSSKRGFMPKPATKNLKTTTARSLSSRIEKRESVIGIIGMGYVGLPLAVAANVGGFAVLGFDVDPKKIKMLNGGVDCKAIGKAMNLSIDTRNAMKGFSVRNNVVLV
jgi:UDP-N-acetyl-D-glucosamine dehydrogenase